MKYYGIQKYLMIALSVVFLWGFDSLLATQEMKKTVLPMEDVTLRYKSNISLLTVRQADQMDQVALHMRRKPQSRIVLNHSVSNNRELIETRMRLIKAYLNDSGINIDRIAYDEKFVACPKCGINSTIRISETSR